MLTREQISARAARELQDAATVYLGEGLPRLLATQLPAGVKLIEAGDGTEDVDVAVVSARTVANDGAYLGDQPALKGKKLIIVLEQHQDDDGANRVLKQIAEPTGKADQVFTPLAIFDVTAEGLVMREVVQGVSALDVQLLSETPLLAADDLKVITL
jgi:acyl CoA:acetate/3-ketoacid CoA transferase beta subunit